MKTKAMAAVFCALLIFTAAAAQASVSSEIQSQQSRIQQGIRTGELTQQEAKIVEDNIVQIKRYYYRVGRNGVITLRERRRLNRMLQRNSREIQKLKANHVRRQNPIRK